MLQVKEQEIKSIAEKAVQMQPQSIRTLIFAAEILLARDQIEQKEEEADVIAGT